MVFYLSAPAAARSCSIQVAWVDSSIVQAQRGLSKILAVLIEVYFVTGAMLLISLSCEETCIENLPNFVFSKSCSVRTQHDSSIS